MGVKKQADILVCDECGKEVIMSSASQRYQMFKLTTVELYQSGRSGKASYEHMHEKEAILCLDCYSKINNQSAIFKKCCRY